MTDVSKEVRKGKVIKVALLAVSIILLLSSLVSFVVAEDSVYYDASDPTKDALETPHDEYNAVQLPAEAGVPVQWVKQVSVQNLYDQAESEVLVSVPHEADNIKVVDVKKNTEVEVENQDGDVTIRDFMLLSEEKSYIVKYETPAPEKKETTLMQEGDTFVKNVIVSSDYHYQDVYTSTDIPETEIGMEDQIKLYWYINGEKVDVTADDDIDLNFHDTDNDGRYETVSWTTPHLSTQIFEVVIFSDAEPGSYSNITIDLHGPADGEYVTSISNVNFNYTVYFNSSTNVYCNFTVDDEVKRENIATAADTEISTYMELSSGQHSWYVNCTGTDGATGTSETRSFTLDLESPSVTLNVPDYYVSYTDSMNLNFTAVDAKYPVFVCALSVNGVLNQTDLVVANNTLHTVTLTGLPNGVYDWNVSCEDAASNVGSSEERVFYISHGTPSEYNISPNKASYAMGEEGYLLIYAPSSTNLSLFVSTPNQDSFFRYFNGVSFPLVDIVNFTSNSGTYNIDGIFQNGGEMYVVKTSFDVTNSFTVSIDTNSTTGQPGELFEFSATSSGGIGNVSYKWDLDDNKTAQGDEIDHTYTVAGEYTVELTATDSKGNTATDTQTINVYNIHDVWITVKELQTGKILEDIAVEVGDQRKSTDSKGEARFEVYEGKTRIYVAQEGYEWVKQVRNITSDMNITIELNNTALTNYTPRDPEKDAELAEQEEDLMASAELLLAEVSAALENLESTDEAENAIMEALQVEANLQKTKKELRQLIRDLGNTEDSKKLTEEEKEDKLDALEDKLSAMKTTITSLSVRESAESIDYPGEADIAMLSSEYLSYKKIEYSKKDKEKYVEANVELQKDMTINTRVSVADIKLLSGAEKTISVVINTVTKAPEDTEDIVLIEYVPKEVAKSSADITGIIDFDVIKGDPILKFDTDLESYAYYVEKNVNLENLKRTRHVLLHEPSEEGDAGLSKVTGFAFLPSIEIKNPKLFIEILVILILVLAYLVYHFEVPDRIREWKKRKDALHEADMSYQPESRFETAARNVKRFIHKEEEHVKEELVHIRALIASGHLSAKAKDHKGAHEAYHKVKGAYASLSKEAKASIHEEARDLHHSITLSKVNHLLDEAFRHLLEGNQQGARSHYSEIKQLYKQLESKHRAAVGERCVQLHKEIFETSLT